MSTKAFLKQQAAALILGIFATVEFIYLAGMMIWGHIYAGDISSVGSSSDTFRGVPNPGGAAAFGIVLIPFVAILCWWCVISDWRARKRSAIEDATEQNKQNKAEMATPRKPSD